MPPPYGAADGTLYTANLRGAKATDVYTCAGGVAPEEYAPTFTQVRPPLISAHLGTSRLILADARPTLTQHGFRYAEVSGLGAPLAEGQVEALELHTDVRQHGALGFSSARLNALQHLVLWGQKSNIMSGVPTDCPQRDERRGWTGDAALTAEEAVMNYAIGAVYTRWLLQYQDEQAKDGGSNNFVPALNTGDGAPNWQSAYPSIVWALYMCTARRPWP